MPDYQDIGLTKSLIKIDSPLIRGYHTRVPNLNFAAQYEVDTRVTRTSISQTKNLIRSTSIGDASGGPFTDGQSLRATFILNPDNIFSTSRNIAQPEVAVYQGTAAVGSLQIFPSAGAAITPTDYSFWAGFDLEQSSEFNSHYVVVINNIAAGTQNIYVEARHKYIQDNSGTSTAT